MSEIKGSKKVALPAGTPIIGGGSPSLGGELNEGSNLDQLDRVSMNSKLNNGWEVAAANAKSLDSSNVVLDDWGHSKGTAAKDCSSADGWNPKTKWSPLIDSQAPVSKSNPSQQSNRAWEAACVVQPHVIPPTSQHGWKSALIGSSRGVQPSSQEGNVNAKSEKGSFNAYNSQTQSVDVSDEDDDELLDDSEGDIDDYDSDASEKSYESRKNNKWLKPFFKALDSLSEAEINEPSRQWHCPACHDGPGAIDWYRGLQPLMTHAKTRGALRVKLHREFASLLEEELQRRGTAVIQAGDVFGKWKGLSETMADHEIVWPPMVMIMNTLLEKDENEKWIGMGNQELLDYFSQYEAVKARHSYGPSGHRGISVLIFEASSTGYAEAERLQKQFADEGRDRDAWLRRRVLFYPGGKRQLYGYLACKEDLNIFNQHSTGKSRLKFEMKSYQEMVVAQMRKMSIDSQKLIKYKNEAVKQQRRLKVFEESFGIVSQKLRETIEENRIVRLRTKMQHEENKEEMDYQDLFMKEQMDKIHKVTEAKELEFEKLLQKERAKARQFDMDSGSNEDCKQRKEKIECFIASQVKGVEEFEAEREKLMKRQEEKKVEMKQKHLEEEVQLEKEFDAALTELMEKYAPPTFQSFE